MATATVALRHVLAYVALGEPFPPQRDSDTDIALLRAANTALHRKLCGNDDAFLFVLTDRDGLDRAVEAIESYGFPNTEIAAISLRNHLPLDVGAPETADSTWLTGPDEGVGISDPEYDDKSEEVGECVRAWLQQRHQGAIPFPSGPYDTRLFWWAGTEADDAPLPWNIDITSFADVLPQRHRTKASTWLTILANAMDSSLEASDAQQDLKGERVSILAATLCEWLHGFEAATGTDYNLFDPYSTVRSLKVSEFFLAFEAAHLSGADISTFCGEHDVDLEGAAAAALQVSTRASLGALRSALSSFFGGDSNLFVALWVSLRPEFARPMGETGDALLTGFNRVGVAEIETSWIFVTQGWCDAADT